MCSELLGHISSQVNFTVYSEFPPREVSQHFAHSERFSDEVKVTPFLGKKARAPTLCVPSGGHTREKARSCLVFDPFQKGLTPDLRH